jgi:hypothetical protein
MVHSLWASFWLIHQVSAKLPPILAIWQFFRDALRITEGIILLKNPHAPNHAPNHARIQRGFLGRHRTKKKAETPVLFRISAFVARLGTLYWLRGHGLTAISH